MKKILINIVVFLTANICFAADLNNQQTTFSKETPCFKLITVTNTFVQMFDGTNTYTMSIEDFISFATKKKENKNKMSTKKYNPEDFVWEPDEKLKRLWGNYYDSTNKVDDSSEETFNGIPIIKEGPAKETILECVIGENSPNVPSEHRLTILDECGRRYDYENLVTNFIGEYSKKNFVQSTTNILINEFFETELDDLTWYYENFDGYVNVNFEVVGYGFSNASKQELEKEIRDAIQKLIDLHFPKKNKCL